MKVENTFDDYKLLHEFTYGFKPWASDSPDNYPAHLFFNWSVIMEVVQAIGQTVNADDMAIVELHRESFEHVNITAPIQQVNAACVNYIKTYNQYKNL